MLSLIGGGDLNKGNSGINFRTDMALEVAEALIGEDKSETISGVETHSETYGGDGRITVTAVDITNRSGERQIGKPMGSYITIESKCMRENELAEHELISEIMAERLRKLIKLSRKSVVLIVGLGNWNVTPDALGPKVVSKTLVTRHIIESLPEELKGATRPVSAFSPGVMGITGIETAEIIRGVVDRVRPELVIAVDALAARHVRRVNASIQITDTGISPGSGMGNKRVEISEKTLGVPVIGIGVPTVVEAATLISDTLDSVLDDMVSELPESSSFFSTLSRLQEKEKLSIIRGILDPHQDNMFVAPKEVDEVVERLSGIISRGINAALHPSVSEEDMERYMA
jgi:spore protease